MRTKFYIPDVGYLLSEHFKVSEANNLIITHEVMDTIIKYEKHPKILEFLANIPKMNVEVLKPSREKWIKNDEKNEIIFVAKSLDDKSTQMIVITTDARFAKRCIDENIDVDWRK